MKNFNKKTLIAIALLASFTVNAQKQNVGIGTTQPDQSAVLDIQSLDKGLLIPRMSVEERNNITNPANGLLIFQTNEESGFYFYNKDSWKPLTVNEAKSVAADPNDWSLNGNTSTISGSVAAATTSSFIGTPTNVPINFKIGITKSGLIDPSTIKLRTYFGFNSGSSDNGPGSYNTGFGHSTLALMDGASYYNTAIGSRALRKMTVASHNVALGADALGENIDGSFNMAIGGNALFKMTTGRFNTAVGTWASYDMTSGFNNTAIGSFAGRFKQGNGNMYLGSNAGSATSLTTENNKLYIANDAAINPLIKGDFSAKFLQINVGVSNGTVGSATTTGYMAIGNFDAASPMAIPSGYRLVVESGILTEKIKVALKSSTVGTDWADYVFEPHYKLMPLEEVENFTKANKHLPNVPSADEMVASGLDVAQTSKMFMEKIEELTLYMIELNKEVKSLKAENEVLKAKLK